MTVLRSILVSTLLLVCVLLAGSCNIVGPIAAVAAGPPTTEALFEVDDEKNHVIFIDDLKSRVPRRSLRDEITQAAEEALLREGVLDPARLISGRAALRVSSSEDSYGDPLSVAELGERVGADVVIYVSMQRWTLSRDGGTLSPSVAGEVKVIDAKSKARLWPPSRSSGYTLVVEPETKVNNADIPREIAQRSQTEIATARQFGLALAQMFYKHETRQSARQ